MRVRKKALISNIATILKKNQRLTVRRLAQDHGSWRFGKSRSLQRGQERFFSLRWNLWSAQPPLRRIGWRPDTSSCLNIQSIALISPLPTSSSPPMWRRSWQTSQGPRIPSRRSGVGYENSHGGKRRRGLLFVLPPPKKMGFDGGLPY